MIPFLSTPFRSSLFFSDNQHLKSSIPLVRWFKDSAVHKVEKAREILSLDPENIKQDITNQEIHSNSEDKLDEIQQRVENIMQKRQSSIPEDLPNDMYIVFLDGKPVLTPKRRPLAVPSKAIALGIAAEWQSQGRKVKPYTMPLMTLAATTIDLTPTRRNDAVLDLLNYLNHDTALIRASDPADLVSYQDSVLNHVVQLNENRFRTQFVPTKSLHVYPQPSETLEIIRSYLQSLDNWNLTCLEFATGTSKSLLIALSLMDGQLNIDQALKASRTEEDYQLSHFQTVENAHHTDRLDTRGRLASSISFASLMNIDPSLRGIRYSPPNEVSQLEETFREWALKRAKMNPSHESEVMRGMSGHIPSERNRD